MPHHYFSLPDWLLPTEQQIPWQFLSSQQTWLFSIKYANQSQTNQRNCWGSMGRLAFYLAFSQLHQSDLTDAIGYSPYYFLALGPFVNHTTPRSFISLHMHHDLTMTTSQMMHNKDPILLITQSWKYHCINKYRTPDNQFQGCNHHLPCHCLFSGPWHPQNPHLISKLPVFSLVLHIPIEQCSPPFQQML